MASFVPQATLQSLAASPSLSSLRRTSRSTTFTSPNLQPKRFSLLLTHPHPRSSFPSENFDPHLSSPSTSRSSVLPSPVSNHSSSSLHVLDRTVQSPQPTHVSPSKPPSPVHTPALTNPPFTNHPPNHPRGPVTLAYIRTLLDARDYHRARQAYATLLSTFNEHHAIDASQSEILRSWAFMEAQHGDSDIARRLFSRAVREAQSPDMEAAAWNAWAVMEQRKGRISIARKCFVNGIRADPSHAPLCQAFAMFEAKHGLRRRARQLFARGVQLNRHSHRTWVAWANFEAAEDNLPKARFLFKSAIDNSSGDDAIPAILAFAKFEERLKRFDCARSILRRGTNCTAPCSKILHALANLESRAGNHRRACQLFRQTLDCPDTTPETLAPTYQAWALAERRVGNIEKARDLFSRGAESNPAHPYIWQAWGVMEHKLRNFEEARRLFQKGVDANPDNAPTWNAWAQLEAELKQFDEARRLYRQATMADERHAQSWQAWAVMEGKLGNLDSARQLFQKAVAADPSCAPAWQAWACMEENAGNVETARVLFQKGVDADHNHVAVWQAWSLMEEQVGEWNQGPVCSLPSSDS